MRAIRVLLAISLLATLIVPFTGNSQQYSPVMLTQIELVTVGENEIGLTWVTNLPSDTSIEYGTSVQLNDTMTIPEETLFHSIMIEDLEPATLYYFKIGSGGKWSRVYETTTIDPEGSFLDYTIAIVGDSHIDVDGQNNNAGFMYSDSQQLFQSTVMQLNSDPEIDRIIFLGDMVNGAREDFEVFMTSTSSIAVPWDFTFGNWEKNEENWEEIAGEYFDLDNLYYSFDIKDYHFIILDSGVNGQVEGSIDSTQFEWLKDDLYENRFTPTIIFMHHPIEDEGIFGVDPTTKTTLNHILDRNGQVISVIAGHNHKNTREPAPYRYHCSIGSVVQYPVGYSKIRLYDKGYTNHFLKVADELQTSEESKLRIDTSAASQTEHNEYLGELYERSYFRWISEDIIPVIASISITPEIVHPGDEVSIVTDIYDPGHGTFSFSYLLEGEVIGEDVFDLTFIAPSSKGEYEVRVVVDYPGGGVSDFGKFTVVDDSVDIDDPPVINDLGSTKTSIGIGETVTITVDASDPDDDPLSYEWKVDGTTISGETGSSIQWSSDSPGTFEIKVRVTANALFDEGSITIEVVEEEGTPQTEEPESTPFPGIGMILITIISILMVNKMNRRKKSHPGWNAAAE